MYGAAVRYTKNTRERESGLYHGVSCYLSRSSSTHICVLARRVLLPFLVHRFGTYIEFSQSVTARKILCNGNIDFSC